MELPNQICKVSIIIPCYNVEMFISKCLESIVNQTYDKLEIICINDGSTDSTKDIINYIAQKDFRIKVVNQNNSGLSSARNTGIKYSTGEFILFVDSDDWLERNTLEMLVKKERADLICFSYNRVFQKIIQPRKLSLTGNFEAAFIQRRIVGLLDKELSDPSQTDSLVTAWGKLYVTNIIKKNKIQFTDTKIIGTEDALFNIIFLEFAETVTIIDKPLYNYRKTNFNSLTTTYKPALFEKWTVLYSKIAEIIIEKNDDFHTALQNRICLSIIGLGLNETFSNSTYADKQTRLKEILSDPLYKKAYSNLKLKYFPLHWKIFFYFAKNKRSVPLLIMLIIMKSIINKK